MVADMRLAMVPASIARKPSRARSCLRSGASAPMPPIWMPTDEMLAKPASANDAMVKERGSSCAFIWPRSAKAMNSFSTARSPSSPPMAALSFHGTPIAHANGRPTQPRTTWSCAGNQPANPWIQPNSPLRRAMSAMNEISIAITFSIRCSPSPVPRAAASTTFTSVFGTTM